MKYLLTAVVLVATLASLPFSSFGQQAANNIKLINSLFEKINMHDSTGMASFFDDSAKLESPNWEGVQTGKQAVTTIYSRYFTGTPDISFKITNIIATGDAVIVEYSFGGQFSHPEEGTPDYMRDKKYILKACTRYNITKGKITAAVNYFDQVPFLRQVGFFDQH